MSIQDLQHAGEIQRITLQPGDRVVLTANRALSAEMCDRIQAAWATFAPDAGPLLVLDQGMSLSVLASEPS